MPAQLRPHARPPPSPAHLLVGCEEEVGLEAPDRLSTPRDVVRRPMDMFRWGDMRGRGAAAPPRGCSWPAPVGSWSAAAPSGPLSESPALSGLAASRSGPTPEWGSVLRQS